MVVDQTWMIVVIDGCGWCLKRLPWTMGLAGGRSSLAGGVCVDGMVGAEVLDDS